MLRACGLSCLLTLSACVTGKDVVARLAAVAFDAGPEFDAARSATLIDAVAPDTGFSADGPACSNGAAPLLVVNQDGRIGRVDPQTWTVKDFGIPSCLHAPPKAAAVDHSGILWLASQDGLLWQMDLAVFSCKQLDLGATKVSALAFVYDPAQAQETLYLIADDQLQTLSPDSLKRTVISPLKAQTLAGTESGVLYALDASATIHLSISSVNVSTGFEDVLWTLDFADAGTFAAGAARGEDFVLAFGRELVRFRPVTHAEMVLGTLPDAFSNVVTLASPACH